MRGVCPYPYFSEEAKKSIEKLAGGKMCDCPEHQEPCEPIGIGPGGVTMLIFVYGTLMTGMSNHSLISPFVQGVRVAYTKGTLYHLPYGYPALVEGDGIVLGELFDLRDSQNALKILDPFEDFYGVGNTHNLYERVSQTVWSKDGTELTAQVYRWAKPTELKGIGVRVANGDWRSYLKLQGDL